MACQFNKVVVLGNCNVGKTSILSQLVFNNFNKTPEVTTSATYYRYLTDTKLVLDIWDTAGQEKFRSISPMYYRSAQVIIVVFDVTNQESYKSIYFWISELNKSGNCEEDHKIYIVGNKIDMLDDSSVDHSILRYIAEDIDKIYYVSAKNNIGIDILFNDIFKHFEMLNEKPKIYKPRESVLFPNTRQEVQLNTNVSISKCKCL